MLKYKVEDRMMVPAVKAHPWTNLIVFTAKRGPKRDINVVVFCSYYYLTCCYLSILLN